MFTIWSFTNNGLWLFLIVLLIIRKEVGEEYTHLPFITRILIPCHLVNLLATEILVILVVFDLVILYFLI